MCSTHNSFSTVTVIKQHEYGDLSIFHLKDNLAKKGVHVSRDSLIWETHHLKSPPVEMFCSCS